MVGVVVEKQTIMGGDGFTVSVLLIVEYVQVRPVYSKTSDNGHSNKRTTSLQWTNCLPPAINCPYISTSEKGQPPNNGQNARPQRVHYSEVPLYTTMPSILLIWPVARRMAKISSLLMIGVFTINLVISVFNCYLCSEV